MGGLTLAAIWQYIIFLQVWVNVNLERCAVRHTITTKCNLQLAINRLKITRWEKVVAHHVQKKRAPEGCSHELPFATWEAESGKLFRTGYGMNLHATPVSHFCHRITYAPQVQHSVARDMQQRQATNRREQRYLESRGEWWAGIVRHLRGGGG